MIDLSKHGELLRNWFDGKLAELKRLYRASEHGFTRRSFLDKCDYKAPTLSVIQSEHGYIFGGFTSKQWMRWSSNHGSWIVDKQSWIFSFEHGQKLLVKNAQRAIYNRDDFLSTFGDDISIYEGADTDGENFSNLGDSYELPSEIKYRFS